MFIWPRCGEAAAEAAGEGWRLGETVARDGLRLASRSLLTITEAAAAAATAAAEAVSVAFCDRSSSASDASCDSSDRRAASEDSSATRSPRAAASSFLRAASLCWDRFSSSSMAAWSAETASRAAESFLTCDRIRSSSSSLPWRRLAVAHARSAIASADSVAATLLFDLRLPPLSSLLCPPSLVLLPRRGWEEEEV